MQPTKSRKARPTPLMSNRLEVSAKERQLHSQQVMQQRRRVTQRARSLQEQQPNLRRKRKLCDRDDYNAVMTGQIQSHPRFKIPLTDGTLTAH